MKSLLFTTFCLVAQAQGLGVQGTLMGQDGRPMALAHARLVSLEGAELASAQADAQGRFELKSEAKGHARLIATGVGHQELSLLLPCDGRPHAMSLRLAADGLLVTKPEAVTVMANGKLGARHAMAMGADGVWRARVPAEGAELRYEVDGVSANGHTINGTGAARFEYDGDSDYLSVAPVKGGVAEVSFDPKAFPAAAEPTISFQGEPAMDRYASVMIQAQALSGRLSAALLKAAKTGAKPDLPSTTAAKAGWSASLKTEADPLVRQALWMALVEFGRKYDGLDFSALPKELPAGSPFFAASPMFAELAPECMAQGPARDEYAAAIFRGLPDKAASSIAKGQLSELIYEGRAAEAKAKLATLEAAHPGLPVYGTLASQIEATARVSVGAPVPAFEIAGLDDAKATYSPASFKGKFLLLDFWATWCGPCRGEMPQLHAAYAKFHPRGLEVLSLSFDQAAGDVAPYRADAAHPMPWHHAFVEKGFQSDLAKAFAVTGIPKPILVGPDGKIVAMGTSLRGEDLERTLAKFLPAAAVGSN